MGPTVDNLRFTVTDAIQDLLRVAEQARREKRLADARGDAAEAMLIVRRDGSRAELTKLLRGLAEIERKLHQVDTAAAL